MKQVLNFFLHFILLLLTVFLFSYQFFTFSSIKKGNQLSTSYLNNKKYQSRDYNYIVFFSSDRVSVSNKKDNDYKIYTFSINGGVIQGVNNDNDNLSVHFVSTSYGLYFNEINDIVYLVGGEYA